ncbi:MAG: hypothetical protein FJW26_21075 [Acidimicrobiia bacterium]|nr:hypothetical protein [Acidimicrobiia bacterium]
MDIWIADWMIRLLGCYALVGALFAVPFVTVGAAKLDPRSAGSGFGFRVMIFPGAAALWPWLLLRWVHHCKR